MNKLLLLFSILFITAQVHAEFKIGYVDLQKALQATSAGKKANKELEQEFTKRKKEFEKMEADIKKLAEDTERKKSVLSEEAFTRKQQELQQEMIKYRETVSKAQADLQLKGLQLSSPLLDKMKTIIKTMATEKGYSMIFE
ncbi:MAG: OmpH family outer membrane protein, partial [Pseudobdellovibrionaceae bacterium]